MPHILTETDLHLVRLHGRVEVIEGITVVRVPDNPGYRWGNCLYLPAPPAPDELEDLIQLSRTVFADQPSSTHVMLRWDGAPVPTELAAHAETLGMRVDSGQVMRTSNLDRAQVSGIEIRPLDMELDWEDIIACNIACDPEEIAGAPDYIAFKEGLRRAWRAWVQSGDGLWWGAFIDDRLVGQAGMVHCPNNRGRYQSVETHPEFRRLGVCTSLVSVMGNLALQKAWCDTLLLGINPEEVAVHVYDRLGFTLGNWQNGMVLTVH
jgi:RimJ/RimL family protein N-acetyltransferase